jgi:hypothetical protein
MRLSHEKVVHLSHLMLDVLLDDDRVDYHGEENAVRQRIVAAMKAELEREDAMEESAARSNPRSAASPREVRSGTSSSASTMKRS